MDLVKKFGPIAGSLSISQYCPPACFELAGKRFEFVLDSGENTGNAILNFLDEYHIEWSLKGDDALKKDKYECRKADDWTYLVTYSLEGKTPRENHTWVIDKEQGLVTFLRCPLGENTYWPHLIESHFAFGYIKQAGEEHTDRKRHGFTDEVVGTGIKWVYGHNMATVHVYYSTNWYRITYPKSTTNDTVVNNSVSAVREAMKLMPGSDEPAYYVKVKEGMYFISITEQNMEKILGDKVGFRSDTLCFLDNWNRLYSVGRGFGTLTTDGQDREIFVMIGKYGVPETVEDHFFTDPNPYLV